MPADRELWRPEATTSLLQICSDLGRSLTIVAGFILVKCKDTDPRRIAITHMRRLARCLRVARFNRSKAEQSMGYVGPYRIVQLTRPLNS